MRRWRHLGVASGLRSSMDTDHGVSYVNGCQESMRTVRSDGPQCKGSQ
jgi:hypothetical protein